MDTQLSRDRKHGKIIILEREGEREGGGKRERMRVRRGERERERERGEREIESICTVQYTYMYSVSKVFTAHTSNSSRSGSIPWKSGQAAPFLQ